MEATEPWQDPMGKPSVGTGESSGYTSKASSDNHSNTGCRPGEHIKIATDIDARGFEGEYECRWEMQDANGENCFPNKRWDFNIRIHVAFNAMAGGEERG